MMKFWLVLVLFVLVDRHDQSVESASVQSNSGGYYIAILPECTQPGRTADVYVDVPDAVSPCDVHVEMYSSKTNTTYFTARNVVPKGSPRIISIQVPPDLPKQSSFRDYNIRVTGQCQNFNFMNEKNVNVHAPTNARTLIQTDKSIYKPGETVHYRIFSLDSEMKIVNAAQTIRVNDAKYHKIREEKGVRDPTGLIRGSFKLSKDPVLGQYLLKTPTWGITAFQVSKQDQTRIELRVDVPRFALASQQTVDIDIMAKYSSTESIRVNLLVKLTSPRRNNSPQRVIQRSITDFSGKASLILLMQDIQTLNNDPDFYVAVEAKITNPVTGDVISGNNGFTLYEIEEKLEYLEDNPLMIPGIPTKLKVKLLRHDGNPPTGIPDNMTVSVQYSYLLAGSTTSALNSGALTDFDVAFSPDYTAEIIIPDIPEQPEVVAIISRYKGASYPRPVLVAKPPSGNFIRMSHVLGNLKVGAFETFRLKSNVDIDSFNLLISSNGRIVKIQEEARPLKSKEHDITVEITREMAPKSNIVIYALINGEIISTGTTISVNPSKNKVSTGFSADTVQPGEEVTFTVRTAPNSLVATIARSENADRLFYINSITENDALKLSNFQCGIFNGHRPFKYGGIGVLTDMPLQSITFGRSSSLSYLTRPGIFEGFNEAPKLRTEFPESWLFKVQVADSNGVVNITTTVPDTITTWKATAYSFSEQTGFALSSEEATVKVIKPFFVNMVLPQSVIRGEEVFVQVDVFNHLTTNENVYVVLSGSDFYVSLEIDATGNVTLVSGPRTQIINVLTGTSKTVIFPIRIIDTGDIPITVTTFSTGASDSVTETLRAEPEGVPVEYNFIELVNLTPNEQYQTTTDIAYPADVVDGTQRVEVKLVGDVLGLTVSNLARLVKMSYGSGEENMVTFTPALFVSDYLKFVEEWNQNRDTEAMNLMLLGYQRQILFKEFQGYYSVFGNNASDKCVWLTAYVAKSFARALELNFIPFDDDQRVVKSAYEFLITNQNEDGSFREKGTIIHKTLQGHSGRRNALTAYVLTALLEYNTVIPNLNNSITKAKQFVENYVTSSTDLYELAIGVYALALAGSSQVDTVLNHLESRAINRDGYRFWEVEAEPTYRWEPPRRQAKPASIEATSYVCMVYAMKKDVNKSNQCFYWLVSQLNNYGGFVSTQDTVVAVQALVTIAPLYYSTHQSGSISVESGGKLASFVSNDINRLDIQEAKLPVNAQRVTVRGTGSGIFLLSISTKFNVNTEIVQPSFSLSASLTRDTPNLIELRVCAAYLRGESSNMAKIEIHLPPDFALTETSKQDLLTTANRLETQNGKVQLYFDKITNNVTPTCISLVAVGNGNVNHVKQRPVRVFDFYNPSDSAVTFYRMTSLDGDFCTVPSCVRDTTGCAANCMRQQKKP